MQSGNLFFSQKDQFEQFESFVCELLTKGLPLPGEGGEKRLSADPLSTAARYGKRGDNQRGVDLIGLTPSGDQIVFQCKYRTQQAKRRFSKTEASQAVALAKDKYPEAVQHVLVTNHEFTTGASDVLNAEGWWQWDGEQLVSLIHQLDREQGYHLAAKHFGPNDANQWFPDGPNLLVDPTDYRAGFKQSQLSHELDCIGREDEITKLCKQLTTTKPRAVLMLGEGGVGKSRVFCEVMERLATDDDPGVLVKIVQPLQNEASLAQVTRKDAKRIILGMDECHLPGYFRGDVAQALLKQGRDNRLFLVARPEAEPMLRDELRTLGWSVDDQVLRLRPLGKESMHELVVETAGRDNRAVRNVAELSGGNALIALVGGRLLQENSLSAAQVINSSTFRTEVFDALRDNFLARSPQTHRAAAKKLIGALSLFSPWDESYSAEITRLLQISPETFEEVSQLLLDSGLMRQQGDLMRIIPDLFAEFLSQRLLSADDRFLLDSFLGADFTIQHAHILAPKVFYTCYYAENPSSSLIKLRKRLLDHFAERFPKAYDKERASILKVWKGREIADSGELLALARAGIELETNPQPRDQEYGSTHLIDGMEHGYVITAATALLTQLVIRTEDTAIRHGALQTLWEHRDKAPDEKTTYREQAPFTVFALREGRTPVSWLEAAHWLEEKIINADPDDEPWLARRSPQLSQYLSPLFATHLEHTDTFGNAMQLSASMVTPEFCPEARDTGFRMLKVIGQKSAMGAMNALDVLQGIAWPVSAPFGGTISEEWTEKWTKIRLKAVEIMGEISTAHTDSKVVFRVRQITKALEPRRRAPGEVEKAAKKLFRSIEETDELACYIALTSEDWKEYPELRAERNPQPWKDLCAKGVGWLLHEGRDQLANFCDSLGRRLESFGYRVSWGNLFYAMRDEPSRIEQFLQYLLQNPDAHFVTELAYLCWLSENREDWLVRFIEAAHPRHLGAVVCDLQRDVKGEPLPSAWEALEDLCQTAETPLIQTLFAQCLNSSFGNQEMNRLILTSIPWENAGTEELQLLENRLSNFNCSLTIPKEALSLIIARLKTLPQKEVPRFNDLVKAAMQDAPEAVFELFHERALTFADDEPIGLPYDLDGTLSLSSADEVAAQETLDAILARPNSSQLKSWFRVAFLKAAPQVLQRQVKTVDSEGLKSLLEIIEGSRQLICLKEPALVRDFLNRANNDFPFLLEQVVNGLMRSVHFQGRSSENGVFTDENVLNKARALSSRFASDDLLRNFYDRIVDYETTEWERNLHEYQKDQKALDQF